MRQTGAPVHLDVIDADEVTAESVDRVHQVGEMAAGQPVVAVEVGDEAPLRRGQPDVAGVGQADGPLVGDDPHRRHVRRGLGDDGGRRVVGAVVDDDELEVGTQVVAHRAQRVADVGTRVADGQHDGQRGCPCSHVAHAPGRG